MRTPGPASWVGQMWSWTMKTNQLESILIDVLVMNICLYCYFRLTCGSEVYKKNTLSKFCQTNDSKKKEF